MLKLYLTMKVVVGFVGLAVLAAYLIFLVIDHFKK